MPEFARAVDVSALTQPASFLNTLHSIIEFRETRFGGDGKRSIFNFENGLAVNSNNMQLSLLQKNSYEKFK